MVELARALAQHPAVYRVDLLTRLIQDPLVDATYGEPEERIWQAPEEKGLGGAYIARLACGPPKTYLRCPCLAHHPLQLPSSDRPPEAADCMLGTVALSLRLMTPLLTGILRPDLLFGAHAQVSRFVRARKLLIHREVAQNLVLEI